MWAIHHNIKHHSYTGAHYHDPDDETWAQAPGILTLFAAQPFQCFFYLYFRLTGMKKLWYISKPVWLEQGFGVTTAAPLVHHLLLILYAGFGASVFCGMGASMCYMLLVWADHFSKLDMLGHWS